MSEFDKDLQVDDIIYAHKAGVHRVTKIEHRFITAADKTHYTATYASKNEGDETTALVYYVTLLNGSFEPVKSKKEFACDAAYCKKIDAVAEYEQDVLAAKEKFSHLVGLIPKDETVCKVCDGTRIVSQGYHFTDCPACGHGVK